MGQKINTQTLKSSKESLENTQKNHKSIIMFVLLYDSLPEVLELSVVDDKLNSRTVTLCSLQPKLCSSDRLIMKGQAVF